MIEGRVAVVTTFGLARTPAQVGMLQELRTRGIHPDCVVGTSLGAINAAALATGRVDALPEFWEWIHEEILGTPLRTVARSMSSRQARKQETTLRKRIAELLPEHFPTELRLVATDLKSGSEVRFGAGDLVDCVMASCALPGVFPPVDLQGQHLIDGGLVAGMPLQSVPDDMAAMIVLDTGRSAVAPEAVLTYRWWEVAALSYAHLIRGQAVNALVHAASRMPVVLISTGTGKLLDFADPMAAIDAGREAAAAQLDALPDQLSKGIYGLPEGLGEFDVLRALAMNRA